MYTSLILLIITRRTTSWVNVDPNDRDASHRLLSHHRKVLRCVSCSRKVWNGPGDKWKTKHLRLCRQQFPPHERFNSLVLNNRCLCLLATAQLKRYRFCNPLKRPSRGVCYESIDFRVNRITHKSSERMPASSLWIPTFLWLVWTKCRDCWNRSQTLRINTKETHLSSSSPIAEDQPLITAFIM